jgi:hypothetical protein
MRLQIKHPSTHRATLALTAGLFAVLASLVLAAAVQAEVTKFYNATLSLSGDCSPVTGLDPVPDPGCPDGPQPPEGGFIEPTSVATDSHGDIYVVNRNESEGKRKDHVDIFDPTGHYIGRVAQDGAKQVAVDSTGHLYVYFNISAPESGINRFDPTVYDPEAGEIEYGSPPVPVSDVSFDFGSIEVDPRNDHLFVAPGGGSGAEISEYAAPVDGQPNELLSDEILKDKFGPSNHTFEGQIALDGARNRLYVVSAPAATEPSVVRIFNATAPYAEIGSIDGPPGSNFSGELLSIAVDEGNGHLIAGDIYERRKVYEFDADGTYLGALKKTPNEAFFAWYAIDNGPESPNQGYLYIPTGVNNPGHVVAFEPEFEAVSPVIEALSFSGLTEDEALLRATVNPEGAATHWVLEYVSQASFEAEGFAAAKVAGEGEIGSGAEGVKVFAPATGLSPGTAYRFRARVENQCQPGGCVSEKEAGFTTFGAAAESGECPNGALRVGLSAALPDCRAYELVTPSNTGGLLPWAPGSWSGPNFSTPPASPAGDNVAFMVFGGVLPGTIGNGGFNGVSYASQRTAAGWMTEGMGPSGSQAGQSNPGGLSADHGYLSVDAFYQGSLLVEEKNTSVIRYPDGSFHLAGEGSVGTDPHAKVYYMAPGGSHVVIGSVNFGGDIKAVHLEPAAPPSGTGAIYDRTADGVLHVVSLLPGEVTPNEDAQFLGASRDGSTIAFSLGVGTPMYVRVEDAKTELAAPPGASFAGLSDDGRYAFFMSQGDLYRFDTESEETLQITETADAEPVNLAADGTSGYFISSQVVLSAPNPEGAKPQPGKPNLYRWGGGEARFVATVTERDAKGKEGGYARADGLALWLQAAANQGPGIIASRTTADGSVLVFESRANLTSYDSGGMAEIYRYDAAAGTLGCVSCDPTGGSPGADTTLLPFVGDGSGPGALGSEANGSNVFVDVPNLSPDGKRAFFQTNERLVAADNDGVSDVYEWEAEGKGSCVEKGGCLLLISSGRSTRPNYLYGVSDSGDDIFFLSSDLLVAQDTDEAPSIYDARVGGGFPPSAAAAGECLGEACQPVAVAPSDPTPASSAYRGPGNLGSEKKGRCAKGKREVRKAGKSRCVRLHKKHHSKKTHKRANAKRRAAR